MGRAFLGGVVLGAIDLFSAQLATRGNRAPLLDLLASLKAVEGDSGTALLWPAQYLGPIAKATG